MTKKQTSKKPTAKPATPVKAAPKPKEQASATPPVIAAKGNVKPVAADPRLPAPGTVLQKTDRHGAVRCECKIEEGGIRYAGTLYRSISSAALAAAKDLGLKNKTQNGYIFWGLEKPPRPVGDPLEALERAWAHYQVRVEAVVKESPDDDRSKIVSRSTRS